MTKKIIRPMAATGIMQHQQQSNQFPNPQVHRRRRHLNLTSMYNDLWSRGFCRNQETHLQGHQFESSRWSSQSMHHSCQWAESTLQSQLRIRSRSEQTDRRCTLETPPRVDRYRFCIYHYKARCCNFNFIEGSIEVAIGRDHDNDKRQDKE